MYNFKEITELAISQMTAKTTFENIAKATNQLPLKYQKKPKSKQKLLQEKKVEDLSISE